MIFIRNLVERRKGNQPVVEDDAAQKERSLCIQHLRKLFLEFLHPPMPLTQVYIFHFPSLPVFSHHFPSDGDWCDGKWRGMTGNEGKLTGNDRVRCWRGPFLLLLLMCTLHLLSWRHCSLVFFVRILVVYSTLLPKLEFIDLWPLTSGLIWRSHLVRHLQTYKKISNF